MTILPLATSTTRQRFAGHGFTLVELVVVILLLGVLGLSISSKFDRGGYREFTYQARLISALRNMQQRAMYDTRADYCFQLNFDSASPAFGPPALTYTQDTAAEHTATCSSAIDYTSPEFLRTSATELQDEGVGMHTLSGANPGFSWLQFDNLGRPQTDVDNCQERCEVVFSDEQQASVCIESQGYIHAC